MLTFVLHKTLTPEAVLTGFAFNFGKSTYVGGKKLKCFLEMT